MGSVRRLRAAPEEPSESELLRQQLARVQQAFYDEKTRPTDLKALSVEMRELRSLIKSAEASENKRTTVLADTADEPIG